MNINHNRYRDEILVCNIDNLPYNVGSEYFNPSTRKDIINLFQSYTWTVHTSVYERQYYQTNVVPVYCFMVGIDEYGLKYISRHNQYFKDLRFEEVEWFPGGRVIPFKYKGEVALSSLYQTICLSVAPYRLEDVLWVPSDSYSDAQDTLEDVLKRLSDLNTNMHFKLFKRVDIDEVFMMGSFTDNTHRIGHAPYWGGLVILMVLPISKHAPSKFVPIPDNALNRITTYDKSFIPKDKLSYLDEITDIEDTTSPIMYPMFKGILDFYNPYF